MLTYRLVAVFAHATGATHQLNGVVLGQPLSDPVTAVAVLDAAKDVNKLMHQRACTVLADNRPIGVHVQGVRTGQPAAPHGVAGTDDEQLRRVAGKDILYLRPDEGQHRQNIHPPDALANRRRDGDVRFAELGATGTELAGELPTGRPVEQPLTVIHADAILAATRPAGFEDRMSTRLNYRP